MKSLDDFEKYIEEAAGFVQKLDYQKKPKKDNKMTQSVNSPKDFDKAFKMFMKGAQKKVDDNFRQSFPNLKADKLTFKKGGRYMKVISTHQSGSGSSVWAFIDMKQGPTYGDILKPASYKAPAKHARGNLFDGSWGLKYVGPYGPAYLK